MRRRRRLTLSRSPLRAMDIDEIFKVRAPCSTSVRHADAHTIDVRAVQRPPLPKGSLKRSFDAGDAAAELPDTHKSLKRDEGQSASSSSSSRAGPSVRDYVEGDDEDDDDDGRRAGRAGDDDARDFAPGGDADCEPPLSSACQRASFLADRAPATSHRLR